MGLEQQISNDIVQALYASNAPNLTTPFITKADVGVTVAKKSANVVLVNVLADLPTPAGGKHTLATNTVYIFGAAVNIGTNYLEFSDNTVIKGETSFNTNLVYTGTGAMLRGVDVSVSISYLTLLAVNPAGSVFNFSNPAMTKNFVCQNFVVANSPAVGTINGYLNVLLNIGNYAANLTGWVFTGVNNLFIQAQNFASSNGGTFISVPSDALGLSLIQGNIFHANTPTVSVNINLGVATITNAVSINNNIFLGTGTRITGFTAANLQMRVIGNAGIEDYVASASMLMEGNATVTTITGVGVWTPVNGVTIAGVGLTRFSMSASNELTYLDNVPIERVVSVGLDISRTGGGGNHTIELTVFKNGVKVANVTGQAETNSVPRGIFIQAPVQLVQNDVIRAYVRNLTGATNLLIVNMQVSL